MDKRALLDKVIAKLESDHKTLAESAMNTYQAATHEESGAEDQYDTRGLEASYLAGAQAKRVADLEQLILQYRFLELAEFKENSPIVATALVELENEDGKRSFYFLLPKGGGMSIPHEGQNVHIITPQAPLGEALIGRKKGDTAILDNGRETKELEIISVH
jgi:transcription elongation GreA/GreB family factor